MAWFSKHRDNFTLAFTTSSPEFWKANGMITVFEFNKNNFQN
jgi:hypothetical protein